MRRLLLVAVAVVLFGAGIGIGSGSSLLSPLLPPTPTATPEPTGTAIPSPTAIPTATPTRTVAQVLRDVAPSIVRVQTKDGEGTGFAAFQTGQVLTAFHVVGDIATRPTVIAADGRTYSATVEGADEEKDLALLSVPSLDAPPLALSSTTAVGEPVIAVGYAAGLRGEPSITRGIISARREVPDRDLVLLQTDAAINPGNSGGPLLNERGEVVGINVLRLQGVTVQLENLGFAVSIDTVRNVGEALRTGSVKLLPTPTVRPFPTATPRPQPIATPFIIKEYPERRPDGGVYLVQQWSDGRFTAPVFVKFESITNPVSLGQMVTTSVWTHPNAWCTQSTMFGTSAAIPADKNGRVSWSWFVLEENGFRRGITYFVTITCTNDGARIANSTGFFVK